MESKRPKAATLAVGTEITDGQISDRNSQWLSTRAVALGYDVLEHRAVPDDRERITRSLAELAREANLIFVTGGLGPTSDDFTRECIADFLGHPLEWNESSWIRIVERLKLRGGQVTENQKRQCYFPRGASILTNSGGTANAFMSVTNEGVRIVSLPGPPPEIAAIWAEELSEKLSLAPSETEVRTLTLLRMMGMGEGALASGVEDIIDTLMESHPGLDRPVVGYRAHAPYVEVKLWAEPLQLDLVQQIARNIRQRHADILVNEGASDVADTFLNVIRTGAEQGSRTRIIDGVTRGEILSRLQRRAKEIGDAKIDDALVVGLDVQVLSELSVSRRGAAARLETYFDENDDGNSKDATILVIEPGASDLEIIVGNSRRTEMIALPKLAGSIRTDRGRKWAVEIALREWERLK